MTYRYHTHLLLLLLSILIPSALLAEHQQFLTFDWKAFYDSSTPLTQDRLHKMIETSEGDIVLAGTSGWSPTSGDVRPLIIKFNSQGDLLWERRLSVQNLWT